LRDDAAAAVIDAGAQPSEAESNFTAMPGNASATACDNLSENGESETGPIQSRKPAPTMKKITAATRPTAINPACRARNRFRSASFKGWVLRPVTIGENRPVGAKPMPRHAPRSPANRGWPPNPYC
jgi:hypothetical protein